MKRIVLVGVLMLALMCVPGNVRAAHVLPYPSFMPGNKLYAVTRIIDKAKLYWQFGSIGRFKYHLALSDKYLVEAKTLFEYGQYLLAIDALKRSDAEYGAVPTYLERGKTEGKDMRAFEHEYAEAAAAHNQILVHLSERIPERVLWTPEKSDPTDLSLRSLIAESVDMRVRYQKTFEIIP